MLDPQNHLPYMTLVDLATKGETANLGPMSCIEGWRRQLEARWTGYKFDRVAEKAVKLQGNALQTRYGRSRIQLHFCLLYNANPPCRCRLQTC